MSRASGGMGLGSSVVGSTGRAGEPWRRVRELSGEIGSLISRRPRVCQSPYSKFLHIFAPHCRLDLHPSSPLRRLDPLLPPSRARSMYMVIVTRSPGTWLYVNDTGPQRWGSILCLTSDDSPSRPLPSGGSCSRHPSRGTTRAPHSPSFTGPPTSATEPFVDTDRSSADEFIDAIDAATDYSSRSTTASVEFEQVRDEIAMLSVEELDAMVRRLTWLQSARPRQLPPADYFVWLLMAGRGSGKTRSGAEDVWWPASREQQRVAIIGPTLADVRKTCFEGESGLIAVTPKRLVRNYNRTSAELWLTNDSYFVGYSSEEPERLRGPQHHRAWCDELAAWRYLDETWDMMMFGLRLGRRPNVIVTTTPKPVGLVRRLLKEPDTILSRESTYANAENLPPKVMQKWKDKYENTRLGRQELHAEILDDNPYALWNQKMLDDTRVSSKDVPDLTTCAVAVDPPVTSGEDADECGITAGGTAMGPDGRKHVYVTHDWSVQGRTPAGWAGHAVSLYHHTKAGCIVAEVNQGGDMVEAVIHQVDPNVPVVKVHATRGKVRRAEPVAALYEQARAHHAGHLAKLEDQMCDFTTDFDKELMGYSPDRVDSLVWLITHLALGGQGDYGMLGAV